MAAITKNRNFFKWPKLGRQVMAITHTGELKGDLLIQVID
jgi:phage baseplate assembly protein gpV